MNIMIGSFFFFMIITLFSCKKDSIEHDIFIIAGRIDSDLVVTDINPDIEITSWEVESDFSLDLNLDEIPDIRISVLNQYIFGGMSLRKSELRVETLNKETFVLADSVYLEVISEGDTLTANERWVRGNYLMLHSAEGCCPPTGERFHKGYWKGMLSGYIGVRYDGRPGWIRAGVPGYTSVKLYEYALSNQSY